MTSEPRFEPSDDEMLRGLLCGELRPTDETVVRRFRELPELRARYEELSKVGEQLEGASSFQREVLEEAEGAILPGWSSSLKWRAPEIEKLEKSRERGLKGTGSSETRETKRRSPGPRIRWMRILTPLAAAFLLVSVIFFDRVPGQRSESDPDPSVQPTPGREELLMSGDPEVEVSHPGPENPSHELFEWNLPGWSRLGSFEVTVYDGSTGEKGDVIGGSGPLRALRWRPSEKERRQWPSTIFFEVVARDENRAKVGSSGLLRSSLSP